MYLILNNLKVIKDKLKNLEDLDLDIESEVQEIIYNLDEAISLAENYYHHQWSIKWVESKTSVKLQLKRKLKALAFDTYSYYIKTCDAINNLVDSPKLAGVEPPSWWNDVIVTLTLAEDAFEKQHKNSIYSKQLEINLD